MTLKEKIISLIDYGNEALGTDFDNLTDLLLYALENGGGEVVQIILDEYGNALLSDTKSKIQELNPNKDKFVFGFITDLHRSRTEYASNGIVDDSFSLKLLAKLSKTKLLDSIYVGGDLINARPENYANYEECLDEVINDFKTMITIPTYFTIGNHDKRYSANTELKSASYFKEKFQLCNHDNAVYLDDSNYYIDYPKYKVRVICLDQYDNTTSTQYASATHCSGLWKQAIASIPSDYKLMLTYHGMPYADIKTELENYVNNGGSIIGAIAGHDHLYKFTCFDKFTQINVSYAFAMTSQLESNDEYCFSVFVVDDDYIHQIKVGREANVLKFPILKPNSNLLKHGLKQLDLNWSMLTIDKNNHININPAVKSYQTKLNISNLSKSLDSDTDTTILSLKANQRLKTSIVYTDKNTVNNTRKFRIYSPQITDDLINANYGVDTENIVTVSSDTDIKAIAMYYEGQSFHTGVVDFILDFEVLEAEEQPTLIDSTSVTLSANDLVLNGDEESSRLSNNDIILE